MMTRDEAIGRVVEINNSPVITGAMFAESLELIQEHRIGWTELENAGAVEDLESAEQLTELEQRYERARPSEFGPLSKQMAEERDALAAKILHPESRGD